MDNTYSHRKGTKKITLTGRDGAPLARREVSVRQASHKFMFGCAEFTTVPYVSGELEGEQKELAESRITKALDLFNFITLPFYWGRFEPQRGKPDTERVKRAAEWLTQKGCKVKGHPLCWHTVTTKWLLDLTNEEILSLQLDRIKRDVSDFAGLIDVWDVINEVVIMPIFNKYDNGITRICKETGRIGLVRKVFDQARSANPDALLLINDFDMSESYDILIEGILEAGIKIDAIGLQSHMHQGYWGEEKTAEILERFSKFNLPLHFTEINLVSGRIMPKDIVDLNDYVTDDWPTTEEGEERQAKEAVSLYKQLFAHKNVEAVTYWSFGDGGWLNAPAGFITADGRAKPVYDEIRKLVKKEWHTSQKLVTDANGTVEVTGFKGEYEAESDGLVSKFTID